MIFIASKITDAIKAEIRKILPDDVKIGDLLPLSTGDHARIEELHPDGRYAFVIIDGPIKAKRQTQTIPSNTITTSDVNLSTSGTSGIDISIPNTPDIKVNVNTDKKKGKIKDPDPYNWYIKKRLKY